MYIMLNVISQPAILPWPTSFPLRQYCLRLSQKHLELHWSGRSGSRSLLGTAVCVGVWGVVNVCVWGGGVKVRVCEGV